MNRVRPTGIVLVAIWFFLSGLGYTATGGAVAFLFADFFRLMGLFGPSLATQSLQLTYTLLGLVLVATGIGKLILGWGLLEGRSWARTWGLVASGVSALGWLAVWAIPMLVASIFSSLVLLMMIPIIPDLLALFYLLGEEATTYCSGYEFAPAGPVPPTIQATAAPTFTPPPPPAPTAAGYVPAPIAPVADPPLQKTQIKGSKATALAWVVVEEGKQRGVQEGLHQDEPLTIGRDGQACTLVLDDSSVSSRHAQIRFEQGRFFLYDTASTNGTFVNGKRTQRQGLLDGDRIKMGDTVLLFKEAGKSGGRQ